MGVEQCGVHNRTRADLHAERLGLKAQKTAWQVPS